MFYNLLALYCYDYIQWVLRECKFSGRHCFNEPVGMCSCEVRSLLECGLLVPLFGHSSVCITKLVKPCCSQAVTKSNVSCSSGRGVLASMSKKTMQRSKRLLTTLVYKIEMKVLCGKRIQAESGAPLLLSPGDGQPESRSGPQPDHNFGPTH